MPFHPFHSGEHLRIQYNLGEIKFAVVSYSSSSIPKANVSQITWTGINPVVFITPEQVPLVKFNEIWAFGSNGRIIKRIKPNEQSFTPILGVDFLHFSMFPEAAETLGVFSGNLTKYDGAQLMNCGDNLIRYNQPKLAMRFLSESLKKIPENTYLHHLLGITKNMNGDNPKMCK